MGSVAYIPIRNYSLHKNDSIANDQIFMENDNLEKKDDIIEIDNTSNSDDFRKNGNENRISYMLFTPTLEDLKNVLYVALNPYFEEFEIAVVSCPCLTRAPYKLAAAGLSGNTGILEVGDFDNFYPRPQTDIAYDIKDILSRCSYDAFVVGSGFAAKPAMPFNGHLTMNAIVSTNPTNVINNSYISYESFDYVDSKIVNGQDQIKCSLFGHFFFSGGKRGPVIKMRAKGRRSRSNIIALIQSALAKLCRYQQLIGLGIVLVSNGGQTVQFLLPHDFVSYGYNKIHDYWDQLKAYGMNCNNLIALGVLISQPLRDFTINNGGKFLRDDCSMFNAVGFNGYAGEFLNDNTPEETEYIVYINIAQEKCCDY